MNEKKIEKVLVTVLNVLVCTAIVLLVAMLVMQAYMKRLDGDVARIQGRYGLDRATAIVMSEHDHMDAVARMEAR